MIEKEINKNLKSEPIYIPQLYMPLLRGARKTGDQFKLEELDYIWTQFFIDLKSAIFFFKDQLILIN